MSTPIVLFLLWFMSETTLRSWILNVLSCNLNSASRESIRRCFFFSDRWLKVYFVGHPPVQAPDFSFTLFLFEIVNT